jgi:prepilin-type N-terminal cleavage/methylation domain-containing protein
VRADGVHGAIRVSRGRRADEWTLTRAATSASVGAMRTGGRARGFSLVELLVSLAVLSLVLAAVLSVLRAGLGAYGWGAARVEAQQSARIALERMARELREAGYDPTGAGMPGIVVAAPALVTFARDLNRNGVIDPTSERVTFLLRAGEHVLRREAGGGAQPIIDGVRRLSLTYFDRAGALTTDPARVASIRIEMEVGRSGPTAVMGTEVAIRNHGGR